jgi:aryl-alcohol dehydrogenase-like predicted oxidoreductase
MIAKVGLGTLGLSGKYLNLSAKNARKIIQSIQYENFEIIDSATVYAEGGNSIDSLLSENALFKDKSVYYKIGADNFNVCIDDLISELEIAKKIYGRMLKCIILHKTGPQFFDMHKNFFDFMREYYPCILLGISTHSEVVLDEYRNLNIDIVQSPLNLIDYSSNKKIFSNAKKYGIKTQARSCLASGLLSGRYSERDVLYFKDSIRGRYKLSAIQINIYNKRIKAIDRIKEFYKYACKKYALEITMSNFAYSVIANIDCVDHIIIGGTTFQQINENMYLKKLPQELMNEITEEHIHAWQSNSL